MVWIADIEAILIWKKGMTHIINGNLTVSVVQFFK